MPGMILKECPKVYMRETHRSRTPDSTLRFVQHMGDLIGMMDVRETSDLDRIGIPVFTCQRIRPDNSTTSHTGKGVSLIQAKVSLTMESIERYSAEFKDEYRNTLVKGNYHRLKSSFNVLDPEKVILSQFRDYSHDRDIHWIWGFDVARCEDILIPACCVYHPFDLDDAFLIHTNTNGLASGNTLEEAIVHGLAEVIERDAWSIARYTRNYRDALYIEDEPGNRFLVDIFEKFRDTDIEIIAKDITSDIGVPVVASFSRDLIHPSMRPIDGFGAHLDPRVAMIRSILEIVTTRALSLQRFGIAGMREQITTYLGDYGDDDGDPRFYAHRQKGLRDLHTSYSDDILQDIKHIIGKLEERGLGRVIAVDLTRSETGIPTVRVIVPGLESYCFDRTRMGERILKAAIT